MIKAHETPVEGAVADAVPTNWVDLYAPAWSRPYLRLSRADRPIGTWLLLMPCWWAILLAAAATDGLSPWSIWLMLGSAVGAFLMRGAGCTWNDITDREIDAEVARTRSRPIPSHFPAPQSFWGSRHWLWLQFIHSLSGSLGGHRSSWDWHSTGVRCCSGQQKPEA